MGRTKKEVDLEQVKALLTSGLKVKQIAKQLQLSRSNLYVILSNAGISTKNPKGDKAESPQKKAWGTMRKKALLDKYKSATTAGIKAGINRKFKAIYGMDINDFDAIHTPVVKPAKTAVKKQKVSNVGLVEQEMYFLIPHRVKQLFDEQNKRIERLEALLTK